MTYFLRSLRYLKPYRVRLALAVGCAVLISVLWAGGLAAIFPAAKVLLSPEGLHGWVYQTAAGRRLGVDLARRPAEMRIEGSSAAWALQVTGVTGDGGSGGGLETGDWLVGLADDSTRGEARPEDIARRLATEPAGASVDLRVWRVGGAVQTVRVTPGSAGAGTEALLWAVGRFPEPQSYSDRFGLLLAMLVAAVVITILRDALRIAQTYLSSSAVMRAINDLRQDNFHAALQLPVTHYSDKGTSDTVSRFVRDTGLLANGQVTLLGKTLVEPAKAAAALGVALLLSWKLTLLALIAGPPAMLAVRRLGKAMRRSSRRSLRSYSDMLEVLQESLEGIRAVKAYTMETLQRRRFGRVSRSLVQQSERMFLISATTGPVVEALGIIAAMGAVAVAGYWVLNNQQDIDVEKFLALMACLASMFDPIRKLSSVSTVFQSSDEAARRIFELQDIPREGGAGTLSLPRHRESIELCNVSFRYPSAAEPTLRGVNLKLQAGRRYAIVGRNGSGKTTLISLVPRLLEPTEGCVRIDGHDISACSLRSVRRQVGLVTQDTVLFHATIEENIGYGARRAGRAEIRQAARQAHVEEFVEALPQGYRTIIGQRGATLSGGQRQRIAIARAILRDPSILIFDEATSQLDSISEQFIEQAVRQFSAGRTTLIIAHRFATVLSADAIILLEAGCVVDTGTHQELLGRSELYGHLYRTQFLAGGGDPLAATRAPGGLAADDAERTV